MIGIYNTYTFIYGLKNLREEAKNKNKTFSTNMLQGVKY